MDPDHLGPAMIVGGNRLARHMQPEVCPGLRDILDLRLPRDPRPQIVIHGEIKGWIEGPHLSPELGTEEHGLLGDMYISPAQQMVIRLGSAESADYLTSLIDEIAIAVDHPNFRMLLQIPYSRGDGTRLVGIVGIDPGEDFSLRPGKSLVNCIGLTLVFFTDPPGEPVFILFDQLCSPIRGAAIYNQVLYVRVVLRKHRADRLFEVADLVIGRGND